MGERKEIEYAPIVLFVYKRIDHAKTVINALLENDEACSSSLFIFSDAPATESDKQGVESVREYIRTVSGFKEVNIEERKTNYGIEKSELDGVTRVLDRFGRVIILEDDIEVSRQFLGYMNYCLDTYENDKSIYTITGYSFLKSEPHNDNLFGCTRSFAAWGWGTWNDRWQNMKRFLTKEDVRYVVRNKSKLDNGQEFSYLLLHQYKKGSITWDVAWYYSCCRNDGLTLFPYNSLVNNIGMDGSGVHFSDDRRHNRIEKINDREDIGYPIELEPFDKTLELVVTQKRAAENISLFRRFKMAVRFRLNALEILISGLDRVGVGGNEKV